jgi:hypothetical protein
MIDVICAASPHTVCVPTHLAIPRAGGQAPLWGMPLWTTPTPQPQRYSSSPPMVSHLCLLSIVPFIIRANVERLTYSSIYVFKHPSSSVRRKFIDEVLNLGGSCDCEGGGNDPMAPWSSCATYVMYLHLKMMIMYYCEHYELSLLYIYVCVSVCMYIYWTSIIIVLLFACCICDLFWRLPIRGGSQNRDYIKNPNIFLS